MTAQSINALKPTLKNSLLQLPGIRDVMIFTLKVVEGLVTFKFLINFLGRDVEVVYEGSPLDTESILGCVMQQLN